MVSIDLSAIHALRGYEVQHYIALQGVFYILSLKGKFYDKIIVEGEEDIVLRGPNQKKFIQVKKKEQLGQWGPTKISKIAKKVFFRWSDSTPIFNEQNCKDTFYIVIQGDISKNLFDNKEDTSHCIIYLNKLFIEPTSNSLKSTSKIKERIIDINNNSDNPRGYEKVKLNYFIRNLRLCVNLPPLEDLKHVIIGRIRDYLKYMTSGLSQTTTLELIKSSLDEIRNKVISTDPMDHIISYDYLNLKFINILENNLDSFIENLERHRDVELTATVLSEKIIKANGDINKVNNSIRLKNAFLNSLIINNLNFIRLKLIYFEYINFVKLSSRSSELLSLSELNHEFIEKNEELFEGLDYIRNIRSLKGLFFNLASYCTFGLEGITDVY